MFSIEINIGNPLLINPCQTITEGWGERFLSEYFLEQMEVFMLNNGGVGLAANQIGIPLRFFIARIGRKKIFMANPRIRYEGIERNDVEGCLSIPGRALIVPRSITINVDWQDAKGKNHGDRFVGLEARVIQHEVDHLNGLLIGQRE